MKTLNRIRMALIYTASAATLVATCAYLATGMWHLLILAIIACAMGITLKSEEEKEADEK